MNVFWFIDVMYIVKGCCERIVVNWRENVMSFEYIFGLCIEFVIVDFVGVDIVFFFVGDI